MLRAFSNATAFAAIVLASACANQVTSPAESHSVSFAIQPGATLGEISLGYQHSCALRPNGTVVCWGFGANGQLDVPSGLLAIEVSAGGNHSCAIRTDATVLCWGNGGQGQATPPEGLLATHISDGYALRLRKMGHASSQYFSQTTRANRRSPEGRRLGGSLLPG